MLAASGTPPRRGAQASVGSPAHHGAKRLLISISRSANTSRQAAYAEYVTSPSRQLTRTPNAVSDVEAGAIPLAALTAWLALVDTADVQQGPVC